MLCHTGSDSESVCRGRFGAPPPWRPSRPSRAEKLANGPVGGRTGVPPPCSCVMASGACGGTPTISVTKPQSRLCGPTARSKPWRNGTGTPSRGRRPTSRIRASIGTPSRRRRRDRARHRAPRRPCERPGRTCARAGFRAARAFACPASTAFSSQGCSRGRTNGPRRPRILSCASASMRSGATRSAAPTRRCGPSTRSRKPRTRPTAAIIPTSHRASPRARPPGAAATPSTPRTPSRWTGRSRRPP